MEDIKLYREPHFPIRRLPQELITYIFEYAITIMVADPKYNISRRVIEKADLSPRSTLLLSQVPRHVISFNSRTRRTVFDWPISLASKEFLRNVFFTATQVAVFSFLPTNNDPTYSMRDFMSRLRIVYTQGYALPELTYNILMPDDHLCNRQIILIRTKDVPVVARRGRKFIKQLVHNLNRLPAPVRTLHLEFDKQWQFFSDFHSSFTYIRANTSFPIEPFYRMRPAAGNPFGPITAEQDYRVATMVSAMLDKGQWNTDGLRRPFQFARFYHSPRDFGRFMARRNPRRPWTDWEGVVG